MIRYPVGKISLRVRVPRADGEQEELVHHKRNGYGVVVGRPDAGHALAENGGAHVPAGVGRTERPVT